MLKQIRYVGLVFSSILLSNTSFAQEIEKEYKSDISVNLISLVKIGSSYLNYYNDYPLGILYKKNLNNSYKIRVGLDVILKQDFATDEYFRNSGQVDVVQSLNQSVLGTSLYQGSSVVGYTDSSMTIQYKSFYSDPKPYLKIGMEKVLSLKWIKLSFGMDLVGSFGWTKEYTFNQKFEIDTSRSTYLNFPYYTSFHNTKTNYNLQTPIFTTSTKSISFGVSPNINFIVPIKTHWEINVGTYFHALFTREKIKTYDYQLDIVTENKNTKSEIIGYYRVGNISIHYKF